MRFHKSELAFFAFIAVVFLAGAVILQAYGTVRAIDLPADQARLLAALGALKHLLLAGAILLAFALMAGTFLIYPLIRTQLKEEGKLRAMTQTLSERSESLEQAALTDPLTGMQNRRYFDEALREYISEFDRIGKPVGLLLLDLDHFKQVNDTHGHDVGDDVLRAVAACLRDLTRYHDVVARLGGEEFAVVAPNMDENRLSLFAERIRTAVAALAIVSGRTRLAVTTSVGLAVWNRSETAEEFYRRADRMLYQAKRHGRNRVCA